MPITSGRRARDTQLFVKDGNRARFIEMGDVGEMLVFVPPFERRKHREVQRRAREERADQQAGHKPPIARSHVSRVYFDVTAGRLRAAVIK